MIKLVCDFVCVVWCGSNLGADVRPTHHGDQAQRWNRQQAVQAPHDGSDQIQHPDLTNTETAPFENPSVQKPRNRASAVKLDETFDFQATYPGEISQRLPSVAALMPQDFVERAEIPWPLGNENDCPTRL